MLKRCLVFFAFIALIVISFFACGGDTTSDGAIVAVISTDLTIDEMNTFRIEVSQETTPGTYGAPIIAKNFPISAENSLPATFTIRSGKAADQNALIRVIGSKDTNPLVLREVEVRVPKDQVLSLPMLLSQACEGQVKTDATGRVVSTCPDANTSCQPSTGMCGSSFIDVNTLLPYTGATGAGADASAPIGPDEKQIEAFVLGGVPATISGTDIFVSLPPGANPQGLAPTITWRGAKIDPDPSVEQDFSQPVKYTITAEDGTDNVYTTHVTVTAPNSDDITLFAVAGGTTYYPILPGDNGIEVDVPAGFDVTHVTPTITYNGKSINPASLVPQNFTNPVQYTVTAIDGETRVYTVTFDVQPANAATITSFSINGSDGLIIDPDTDDDDDPGSIDVSVAAGDISNVTPTIQFIGGSISPAANVPQNFNNPVTYTVTSVDGSVHAQYVVTVSKAAVSPVTFSPLGGNYLDVLHLKLSCATPGATIHYITGTTAQQNTDVTETDPLYNGASVDLETGVAQIVRARCFSSTYGPAQQATFQIYSVDTAPIQAPLEVDFAGHCGQPAPAAQQITITYQGASGSYSSADRDGSTTPPFSVTSGGSGAANSTPFAVVVGPASAIPAKPESLDDITEVLDFSFPQGTRSVTLRETVSCP